MYARGTSVNVDRSKAEIERTLGKYGAEKFAYFVEAGQAQIAFQFKGRAIRMKLVLPKPDDFVRTNRNHTRTVNQRLVECEKATRQKWRALLLIIKAKLEAIEAGISTFDDEWLAYLVLPTGKTVGEQIGPQIAEGRAPTTLLLGMEDDQ